MENASMPQWAAPDVSCIMEMTDLNEVNNRIHDHGWRLLGIIYNRKVGDNGAFIDHRIYIIGGLRQVPQQ